MPTEDETYRDFVSAVARMRAVQRRYFRTRSSEALTLSKKIEAEVDELLETITTPQLRLFPEDAHEHTH